MTYQDPRELGTALCMFDRCRRSSSLGCQHTAGHPDSMSSLHTSQHNHMTWCYSM